MRQHNNRRLPGRSRQEASIITSFPTIKYEALRLPYVREHTYIPDFCLSGGVCLELKEYMTLDDCAKYEAVARCNTHIKLVFWIQKCSNRVLVRLRTNFVVYYGSIMPLELRLLLIEESKMTQLTPRPSPPETLPPETAPKPDPKPTKDFPPFPLPPGF